MEVFRFKFLFYFYVSPLQGETYWFTAIRLSVRPLVCLSVVTLWFPLNNLTKNKVRIFKLGGVQLHYHNI